MRDIGSAGMGLFAFALLASLWRAAYAQPTIDVKQTGARGDGTGDDSGAIQRALDQAAVTGGEVRLPAGQYRLEGPLRIPPGVTLTGVWQAPHHAKLTTGTVLLAIFGRGQEEGPPLLTMDPNSALRGVTIYYPEQTIDDVQPYPWTISGHGMHGTVENVTLVNPYRGIEFATRHNELHTIRNIYGCPLKTGVYTNNCTDIGRIENVHFNPHYWFRSEGDDQPRPDPQKLITYLLREGEAFVFGRTDWEYVLNTFCYGYRVGYRFIRTEQGVCNGNFLGIGGDANQYSVQVDDCAPMGVLISNGEFVAMHAQPSIEVWVTPTNTGVVQFSNCAFWGPSTQCARVEGRGTVSFSQCNFLQWGHDRPEAAAVEVLGGSVIVQSSIFHRPQPHLRLGAGVRTAVILGNQTNGPLQLQDESQGQVEVVANVRR